MTVHNRSASLTEAPDPRHITLKVAVASRKQGPMSVATALAYQPDATDQAMGAYRQLRRCEPPMPRGRPHAVRGPSSLVWVTTPIRPVIAHKDPEPTP